MQPSQMAIYTPRGLKVRLPLDWAFALTARLQPRIDAFTVLKTTEALECTAGAATFIVGMTCFAFRTPPIATGVAVATTAMLIHTLDRRRWIVLAPLIPLARVYSYVSGYGILVLALSFVGYVRSGWLGIAAFFAGKGTVAVLNYFVEFAWMKRAFAKTEIVLTASERHFFNAYRWHALKVGASGDVNVTAEELHPSNWQPALTLLTLKWPAVVRRFTPDDATAVS
jgi:hypothetical protein